MTTLLLLLALILLVAVPAMIKENPTQVLLVRAALLGLMVVLLGVRWISSPPERLDGAELSRSTTWAAGWKLGQVVSEAFPDGGKLAVFVNDSSREVLMEQAQSQLDGLQQGSKGTGFDIQIMKPQGNAKRELSDLPDAGDMNQQVMQVLDATVIVSFVPFPFSRLKSESLPPVYLFDERGTGYWKGWMKQGRVAGVVAPHTDYKAFHNAKLQRGSPADRFRAAYELITPE